MTMATNLKSVHFFLSIIIYAVLVSLSACNADDEAKRLKLEQLQTKWDWQGKNWQSQELLTLDDGEQHYLEHCASCHSVNGSGNIRRRSPALRYNPLVNDNSDVSIKVTLFGKRKMLPYHDKLSNKDIASIVSYIRNAWNNNSGELTTENKVKSFRHFNVKELKAKWNWEGKQWQEKELRFLEFGENNYSTNCAGCHLKNGSGQIQIGAPALKGNSLVKGDPEQQIIIVLKGINVMPSYAKLLSDEIIASIISYEKNTWGLKSGNIVSPELVAKLRQKIIK